jgi:hypothetical protein
MAVAARHAMWVDVLLVLLATFVSLSTVTGCPLSGVPPAGHPRVVGSSGERLSERRRVDDHDHTPSTPSKSQIDRERETAAYGEAVRRLDLRAVQQDLRKLFVDSKPEWPADYGNYG